RRAGIRAGDEPVAHEHLADRRALDGGLLHPAPPAPRLRPRGGALRARRRAPQRGAGACRRRHRTGMSLVAEIALAAIALFAALSPARWAPLRYWVRRLTLPLAYATTEQLDTPDGAHIELRRVPIPGDVEIAALPPVLLVHGLGANYRNQDLHPDYSLA